VSNKKLFSIKNGEKIGPKDKLRNIREETEPMLPDESRRNNDVNSRITSSVRILERRYNQPKQSQNDVDVEMATVLITFPRH
jgi:hypothetical protein